jgi:hypothetical protein
MSNENLERWNRMKRPPPTLLKPIRGGRLSGKTNINPQWRDQILTEEYGPCGTGWKYTIDEVWTFNGAEGQVFAFANVSLYVKEADEWSAPITMVGGDMLIEIQAGKLYHNDEAFKMAITDGLGKAAAKIGVAADVYMELWDGSKYLDAPDHDEEKDSQQLDWISACEAAYDEDPGNFPNWWKDHGQQIKEQVGEARASVVYDRYKALCKLAKEEVPA